MKTTQVEKKDFLRKLRSCHNTVAGSKIVELQQCFCFRNGQLSAYNGYAGTITACDLDGMEFCVNATKLLNVVANLFDTIKLVLDESSLRISSGNNKTTLQVLPTRGFPELIPDQTDIYYDEDDLVTALAKVSFTVGNNMLKPELLGIALSGEYAYSSDGKRVTRYKLKKAVASTVCLPWSSVEQICKLGKPTYTFTTGTQIGAFYEETKTIYSSNTMQSKFPVALVDKLFSSEKKFPVTFPEELQGVLRRVRLLAPSSETDVVLQNTEDGVLTVKSHSESGSAQEDIKWNFKHPFAFAVDPDYLLTSLTKCSKADLTDIISGQKRKIWFTDGQFDHSLGLMLYKGE